MKQDWKKLGFIFNAEGQFDWMQGYATVPTPLHLYGDVFRVYFSTRNDFNHNQVGFIEIDINNPGRILRISEKPVIALGELGFFDCDGVYGTSIVKYKDGIYFYYAGWNAGLRGLFYSSIGLAISYDGGISFEKYKGGIPILARSEYNKWACMAPFVLKEEWGWKMWYASGCKMVKEGTKLKSFYDIKSAVSSDGLEWKESGQVALPLSSERTNIARPCVVKHNDIYKCWFPFVSPSIGKYRIGYAESIDNGINFKTISDDVIAISDTGIDFDSTAVTYPYVFSHNGKLYMLYNGNDFGKTGFGLAILQ